MTPAPSGTGEPAGLDPARAVQIITTRPSGAGRRGSGYRMTGDVVLTAAHVIGDAASVQVRFVHQDGSVRDVPGETVWADVPADIALLKIADGAGPDERYAVEVPPVRFARVGQPVDCAALGFPRFKLRRDAASPERDPLASYRDTHHALGQAVPLSNQRQGTLEIARLAAPEHDQAPDRSPWEGMSGAAVWSEGCLIGIVSEHHRSDGLGRLTARPVHRWYAGLSPARIGELGELIGLPPDADRLDRLPRPSPPPPDGPPELREAVRKLAATVHDQWDREERRRKVHDPMPLTVRFRLADAGLFDHWANIRRSAPGTDPGPLPLAGRLQHMVRVYRSVPSARLVVLGAAGSGKTILTLRFVLDRLGDRSPDDPVPVIFGLGAWDPRSTSLRDWMCDQLVRDYGLAARDPDMPGRNLAGALVDTGRILPVLDGFDEIASGLQGEALDKLNATTTPLLLTSRPAQYAQAVAATDVLSAAAVVQLDDLTLGDLADYLPRASRPGVDGGLHGTVWEPVLARLGTRPRDRGAHNVATVLTTPLMVAMARTIYSDAPGRDPSELLDTTRFRTADDLRKHLLAAFTPTAYHRPPTDSDPATGRRRRRHWDPERAHHWLGYLAAHLTRLDTADLAWWQLGTTLRRSTRVLVVGFLAALSFGVTTAVGNLPVDLVATSHGARFALVRGLVVGLLHGLVVGFAFGMVYAFISRGATEPSRFRVRLFGRGRRRRARFLPRFTVGLAFGTPIALVLVLVDRGVVGPLGLADGLDGGLLGALMFVPGAGLGIGLVLGIVAWLEVPSDIRSAVRPAALLNDNRKNVVFHMLVWALVFGLAAGVANGIVEGPMRGFLAGLVFAGEAAFGCGLGYGLSWTAWGQWVALSRIWLPLTGRVPWALIAFLNDACERGVLRQAGAVYQFRHAELRDHLAQTFRERDDQRPFLDS
ncbi:putative NTPase (NACHT family) [Streptomyces noursei ATCC 11455]|uniref:trypsin-like peptidase domain-containing protein n=1 Tax=Streptomyces noursei TaxID=1971 RepID=UPI00081D2C32|nr:putative NTPase (NACHT family) [Streptomyces noursei ATCC 11455]